MTIEEHKKPLNLKQGDLVEVRSADEILATVDGRGELDQLPFMPEMLKYCGQTLEVYRRADKTCNTIDGPDSLRMQDAVHLVETRCDGSAHGGCEANCFLFWKEAWLKQADTTRDDSKQEPDAVAATSEDSNAENSALYSSCLDETTGRYSCQATELKRATTPLQWWDVRQYVRDVRNGNANISSLISSAFFAMSRKVVGFGFAYSALIRIYDRFQALTGGLPYPIRIGRCRDKTPTMRLDLKIGEYVRVKSHEEILETLNENSKNRGLWFDAEMVPHCEKIYRVSDRVEKIINEQTGQMMHFENPCIVLENVYCRGRYTQNRLFCPRSILSYWREIWLERIDDSVRKETQSTTESRP